MVQLSNCCGGALIKGRWIASAWHCLPLHGTEGVYYSIYGIDGNATPSRPPKQIIPHPLASTAARPGNIRSFHDITLMEVDGVCESVQPLKPDFSFIGNEKINKTTKGSQGEQSFIVAVWGLNEQDISEDELHFARPPMLNRSQLDEFIEASEFVEESVAYSPDYYAFNDDDFQKLLFAGHFNTSGPDSCQGDSGTPLWIQKNQTARQVGITVAGFGTSLNCGRPGVAGIYLRLSEEEDFIVSHTGISDDMLWQWQSARRGFPKGSWRADSLFLGSEILCRTATQAGRYDRNQQRCITLSEELKPVYKINAETVVGTLRYNYEWRPAPVSDSIAFSSCVEQEDSGDRLYTSHCENYCLAKIENKSKLGVIRNNLCILVLNEQQAEQIYSCEQFQWLAQKEPITELDACREAVTERPSSLTPSPQPDVEEPVSCILIHPTLPPIEEETTERITGGTEEAESSRAPDFVYSPLLLFMMAAYANSAF